MSQGMRIVSGLMTTLTAFGAEAFNNVFVPMRHQSNHYKFAIGLLAAS